MAYEFQVVVDSRRPHLHLDLRRGGDSADEIVVRLTERGAKVLHTGSQGPHVWWTLADPEGNEFCVG